VAVVLALLIVTTLVVHAQDYLGFFADDSFISLRYAKRLLQGHGLTWSDGDRVEGYTNFLWVIVIAAVGAFGSDLVPVAHTVGLVTMSIAVLAVAAPNVSRRAAALLPACAASLALCLCGPVATWSVGGLETPLLCALHVTGMVFVLRIVDADQAARGDWIAAGSCWALAAVTRPDGLLVPCAAAAALVVVRLFRKQALKDALLLVALPLAAAGVHLLARRLYYGEWVPNTYYAKVAPSWNRAKEGLAYVLTSQVTLIGLSPPLVLTVLAAITNVRRRRRIVLVSIPLVVWVVYVMAVGGDIMRHYRHVVPAMFLIALLDAEGFSWLVERGRAGLVLAHLSVAGFLWFVYQQALVDPGRADTLQEHWEWSGRAVGLFLKENFGSTGALLAVDAAGATPYYSELDAVDMLGLNDRYLAHHRPASFGTGWMAHELGDGNYVLGRKPDLVLLALPPGWDRPLARSGMELMASPVFRRTYKLIQFDTLAPTGEQALLWVRTRDGRIGVAREGNRIHVPGYLFAQPRGPVARRDGTGVVATFLGRTDVGALPFVALPRGSFKIEGATSGNVIVSVTSPLGLHVEGAPGTTFRLDTGGDDFNVFVRPAGGDAVVRAIDLVRVAD
jgi:hypothetical protein